MGGFWKMVIVVLTFIYFATNVLSSISLLAFIFFFYLRMNKLMFLLSFSSWWWNRKTSWSWSSSTSWWRIRATTVGPLMWTSCVTCTRRFVSSWARSIGSTLLPFLPWLCTQKRFNFLFNIINTIPLPIIFSSSSIISSTQTLEEDATM